jgi:hypothetical protein
MMDTNYRVMELNKWHREKDGSAVFRVACDCGSPEHDLIVWFDKEIDDLTVQFYCDVTAINPYWSDFSFLGFFKKHWWNFKKGLKLIFTGDLEFQHDLILGNKKHIDSLIAVLEEGKAMLNHDLT